MCGAGIRVDAWDGRRVSWWEIELAEVEMEIEQSKPISHRRRDRNRLQRVPGGVGAGICALPEWSMLARWRVSRGERLGEAGGSVAASRDWQWGRNSKPKTGHSKPILHKVLWNIGLQTVPGGVGAGICVLPD